MAKNPTQILSVVKLRDEKTVIIYYRNQRFPTGITINNPNEFKNGKLTALYQGEEHYTDVNLMIQNKKILIDNLILEASKKTLDVVDYINTHLRTEQNKLKNLRINNNTNVDEAFAQYLEYKKNITKDFMKDKSFHRYNSELSRLKDYKTVINSKVSDLTEIEWFLDFSRWLSKPYKKTFNVVDRINDREYTAVKTLTQTNSSIKRFLMDLKAFCIQIQLNSDIKFPLVELTKLFVSLKTNQNDNDNIIACTKKQVEALKRFEPKFEWQERTIDCFLFGCSAGLRYSDIIRLNKAYVNNDTITMKAEKTRNKFEVPMNAEALRIFKKYNYDFRDTFASNQQINKNLKKIFKTIPEFCEDVVIYNHSLNKVKEKIGKGYDVIRFHASRRTFATFVIQAGATQAQLQKFVGWSDSRTISSYLSLFSDKDNNDRQILNF